MRRQIVSTMYNIIKKLMILDVAACKSVEFSEKQRECQ